MCQFWLNESAGTLTSPHFFHDYANPWSSHTSFREFKSLEAPFYGHNLNCTWMIDVKDGFYINLEITYFAVKLKKTYKKRFHDFPKHDLFITAIIW